MRNSILKLLLVLFAYSSGLYTAEPEELASDPRGGVTAAALASDCKGREEIAPLPRGGDFDRKTRVAAAALPGAGLAKRKNGKGFGNADSKKEADGIKMILNPISRVLPHTVVVHAGDLHVPVAGDDARIRARLNAYMRTHLDTPFNKKEMAAAVGLGVLLSYGGIEGVAPTINLLIDWAFPDGFYSSLTLAEQNNIDTFSIDSWRASQPFLGLYGLARGYDLVNRARYARNGQFADLFAPVKKGVAAVGYSAAIVTAGALAANQVSLYYELVRTVSLTMTGSFDPAPHVDQFTILGIYAFCESLDPMASGVAGFTRPSSTTVRKDLLEGFAKAAQGINKLEKQATLESYTKFKGLDPVNQLQFLMKQGEGEELPLPSFWHLLLMKYKNGGNLPAGWGKQACKEVLPVVIGGFAAYIQWQFARELPARFDIFPGTALDEGVGYAAAIFTTGIKGGLAYMQTKAMGRYVHDVFTCNRANQAPSSTRRSRCYEVINTVVPMAYSSLLALSVGLNIYFQLNPDALPDQEYTPAQQWGITALSAYTYAEIANYTVRLAQGNAYLPEVITGTKIVVTNTTKRVKNGVVAGAKRAKDAVAACLPDDVKERYAAAKTTVATRAKRARDAAAACVPDGVKKTYAAVVSCVTPPVRSVSGWLSSGWGYARSGCGYVGGKINQLLTGRAPGEDISATQMRNEMISLLEKGQYIAQAGTNTTVRGLARAIG